MKLNTLLDNDVEIVIVVVIKDNVVESTHLCVGNVKAELLFMELVEKIVPGWVDYDADDVENILSDGYVEYPNGSICITHPE